MAWFLMATPPMAPAARKFETVSCLRRSGRRRRIVRCISSVVTVMPSFTAAECQPNRELCPLSANTGFSSGLPQLDAKSAALAPTSAATETP